MLLKIRNISDNYLEKIETLFSIIGPNFFRKSFRLQGNGGKYGTGRQATDDNITRHMSFACWVIKATDTHT